MLFCPVMLRSPKYLRQQSHTNIQTIANLIAEVHRAVIGINGGINRTYPGQWIHYNRIFACAGAKQFWCHNKALLHHSFILLRRSETLFLNARPVPEITVRRDIPFVVDLHNADTTLAPAKDVSPLESQLLR